MGRRSHNARVLKQYGSHRKFKVRSNENGGELVSREGVEREILHALQDRTMPKRSTMVDAFIAALAKGA